MSEQDVTKEVRRLRHLLLKMAELAEHVEQTGSFESGVHNSIIRYNGIVARLEAIEALPASMFPKLGNEADAGQLGAEATLLAEYLKDMSDDEGADTPGRSRTPDLGALVALAPFLESEELSKLVRERISGPGREQKEEEAKEDSTDLDLKTLVSLAPHLSSADLSQMVRACMARGVHFSPKYLTMMAPHMESKDLGMIMRTSMPDWFKAQQAPRPEEAPRAEETPAGGGEETDWGKA